MRGCVCSYVVSDHPIEQGKHLLVVRLQAVKSKEGESAGAQLQYTCRCSFLQIYNEQVMDLLKPGDKPLNLRHDSTRGVFAEHLSEHVVVNGTAHHHPE